METTKTFVLDGISVTCIYDEKDKIVRFNSNQFVQMIMGLPPPSTQASYLHQDTIIEIAECMHDDRLYNFVLECVLSILIETTNEINNRYDSSIKGVI